MSNDKFAKAKFYQDKAVALSNVLVACGQDITIQDRQQQINEVQELFKQAEVCINSCNAKTDIRQVDYLSAMRLDVSGVDEKKQVNIIIYKDIKNCNLPKRLVNLLKNEGFDHVGDLCHPDFDKQFFKDIAGMGKGSFEALTQFLSENSLSFAMEEMRDFGKTKTE